MIGYSRKLGQNNAYLYKLLPNGEITTLYGIIGRSGVSTFFIYLTAIGNYKVEYVSDFSSTNCDKFVADTVTYFDNGRYAVHMIGCVNKNICKNMYDHIKSEVLKERRNKND